MMCNGSPPFGSRTIQAAVDLVLETGLPATFEVVSDSMLPTIPPSSAVRMEPARTRIRRGDVLVFRQADYVVVHRVLGVVVAADGARSLRTRGDGAPALDPPVALSRVVGRVVAVRRVGTWRAMTGVAPRAYAWGVACHSLFWSGVAVVSERLADRILSRRIAASLRARVEGIDRVLLVLADLLCFRLLHRRVAQPVPTGGASGAIDAG